MDLIQKYFPKLDETKLEELQKFSKYLLEWNAVVNLISRKDSEQIVERHILHSLSIVKFLEFKKPCRVMDLGTGGGFPGLPLAIFYPDVEFVLVDSIAKKIRVVDDIREKMNLKSVQAVCARAESIDGKFDFVVTRAVAPLIKLNGWVKEKISSKHNHSLKNGIIALKGGDLKGELSSFGHRVEQVPISTYFEEEFFESKSVVYLSY